MSKRTYQKGMEGKRENDFFVYNIPRLTAMNKNYERVIEANTHEIPKLYTIKTEKKSKGSFY